MFKIALEIGKLFFSPFLSVVLLMSAFPKLMLSRKTCSDTYNE